MTIVAGIQEVQQQIRDTAKSCGREPQTIQLLAVSKGHSVQAIQEAFHAGLFHFGENYLQEAEAKITALATLPLCWHFIGSIQSNKAKRIAQHFSWVHSVSQLNIASLLAENRPARLPPLHLCLQVNLDKEESKAGVEPDKLLELAAAVQALPGLKLRGLMAIPKPQQDKEQQYKSLLRLTELLAIVNSELKLSLDTLSMGMSDDLQAAIRAGSTIVRIGRAIFGERLGQDHEN